MVKVRSSMLFNQSFNHAKRGCKPVSLEEYETQILFARCRGVVARRGIYAGVCQLLQGARQQKRAGPEYETVTFVMRFAGKKSAQLVFVLPGGVVTATEGRVSLNHFLDLVAANKGDVVDTLATQGVECPIEDGFGGLYGLQGGRHTPRGVEAADAPART
jgi:hypothetical protein